MDRSDRTHPISSILYLDCYLNRYLPRSLLIGALFHESFMRNLLLNLFEIITFLRFHAYSSILKRISLSHSTALYELLVRLF